MKYPRTWPAATTGFFSLPLSLLITLEVLFTALLIGESCMLIRIRKEHPTSWAVKETLDLLPAGVAFAEEDGRVVFANITMNEIAQLGIRGTGISADSCGECRREHGGIRFGDIPREDSHTRGNKWLLRVMYGGTLSGILLSERDVKNRRKT